METLEQKIKEELLRYQKEKQNKERKWIIFRSKLSNSFIIVLILLYMFQQISVDMVLGWGSIIATLTTLWNYFKDTNKKENNKRVLGMALGIIVLALTGDFGGYLIYK